MNATICYTEVHTRVCFNTKNILYLLVYLYLWIPAYAGMTKLAIRDKWIYCQVIGDVS